MCVFVKIKDQLSLSYVLLLKNRRYSMLKVNFNSISECAETYWHSTVYMFTVGKTWYLEKQNFYKLHSDNLQLQPWSTQLTKICHCKNLKTISNEKRQKMRECQSLVHDLAQKVCESMLHKQLFFE